MKCEKCKIKIDKFNHGVKGLSPKGKEVNYCSLCIEKKNVESYKKLKSDKDKVMAFVDDEIYTIMKKSELHFNLSWTKARNLVNKSIKTLYEGK